MCNSEIWVSSGYLCAMESGVWLMDEVNFSETEERVECECRFSLFHKEGENNLYLRQPSLLI